MPLKEALSRKDRRGKIAALASWVQESAPTKTRPVLVGGSAIMLYVSDCFCTGDLDFVGVTGSRMARVLETSGFVQHGREWMHEAGQVFLEFRPGALLPGERAVDLTLEGCTVRVMGPEELIINRLASWTVWSSPVDGLNALLLYTASDVNADDKRLDELAKERGAEPALASLRSVVGPVRTRSDLSTMRRWAYVGLNESAMKRFKAGAVPPPRRRRPRGYLKWASLRRWGQLPAWEDFSAGYLLREAREKAKITQAELAHRLGVTQQAVAQAERWKANPTAHFMRAWAAACGTEVAMDFQ